LLIEQAAGEHFSAAFLHEIADAAGDAARIASVFVRVQNEQRFVNVLSQTYLPYALDVIVRDPALAPR
jgi:hypothetical protein